MCADVAIHDTGDGNPHAHIMLTLRPLDENGKWQSKTEKEYLCVKGGEERGFTATEFKAAQTDGWEKQYQYKVGKKKVYMVPSEAEAQGHERASKYPKCTRYGRQNPTYERWNDVIMLDSWRTYWAETMNRALEEIGSRERVDHRSHALRGLDEQPTIHEGVTARALEKKGIISERCELNRQIRKDNALLRRLKEMVAEMIRKIRGSVTNIAENLETNWMYMVEAQYHLTQILNEKQDILNQLEPILDDYEQYVRIQDQIRKLAAQRDKLIAQRKATPILQIRKRNELAEQIDSLTRQLEGRRKAKENLLKSRHYPSEKEMQEVGKRLYAGEEKVTRLEREESTYSLALQRRQEEYSRWIQHAQNVDSASLSKARTTFRSENINRLASKLNAQYGTDYKNYILQGAIHNTDRWCAGRETPTRIPDERKSVRAFLERESKRAASEPKQTRKRLNRDER